MRFGIECEVGQRALHYTTTADEDFFEGVVCRPVWTIYMLTRVSVMRLMGKFPLSFCRKLFFIFVLINICISIYSE